MDRDGKWRRRARAAGGTVVVLLLLLAAPGLTGATTSPADATGQYWAPIWSPAVAGITLDAAAPGTRATGEYLVITAKAGAGAWIKPVGEVYVLYGATEAFDFGPQAGFHIIDVVIDGVSRGPLDSPYEFKNVTAKHSIEVLAAIDTFVIAPASTGHGRIEPSDAVEVPYAGSQKFTMTADPGYHLDKVLVDGVPVEAVYVIAGTWAYTFENVLADHSIVASFLPDPRVITATAGPGAWITPAGRVQVPYGGSQTFDFGAVEGYRVTQVLIDGRPGNTAATSAQFMNVTEDHSIEVKAEIKVFTITAHAGPNGSVEPSGLVSAPFGTNKDFTFEADPHYHLDKVLVDGRPATFIKTGYRTWVSTVFDVRADHDLSATFARDTCVISAACGEHGRIDPSGRVTVEWGRAALFHIYPDQGYRPDVGVDYQPATPSYSEAEGWYYLFPQVTSDHALSVVFVEGGPPDVTPPSIRCPWDGLVLGKQADFETLVFRVVDEPGGSGASTNGHAVVGRFKAPSGADRAIPLDARVITDSWVSFLGALPVSAEGSYYLRLKGSDRAGNSTEKEVSYMVAGRARVGGAPSLIDLSEGRRVPAASGEVALSSRSSSPGGEPVKLTLTLRSSAGRPVSGAHPRLFVYDETSGTCIFRAAKLFKAAGKGMYTYLWSPERMTPDPAWGDEWRDLQLVVPLDGRELGGDGFGAARDSVRGTRKPTKPTVAVTTLKARW